MISLTMLTQGAADAAQTDTGNGGAVVALFVVIAAIALWVAFRAFIRGLQAKKTETATGGDFTGYALAALVNAAKLDGRVNAEEKRAIAIAMREIAGEAFEAVKVEEAFARPGLNKDELVSFLASRSRAFTRDQKVALLKALMAVFVSDGKFEETEHSALIDYTAAIGFDRQGVPEMLRGFERGSIT
jgi:uncharacterized membrane protein YebE (DUF533 family)